MKPGSLSLGPWLPLSDPQRKALEEQGNQCEDWSGVLVQEGFEATGYALNTLVGQNRLCSLGPARSIDGIFRSPKVQGAILVDCTLGPGSCIEGCGTLEGLTLEADVTVMRVGRVRGGQSPWTLDLAIGNEMGGRTLRFWAGMKHLEAKAVLEGTAPAASPKEPDTAGSFLGRGVEVMDTPLVEATRLGPFTEVRGATLLKRVTTLSSVEHPVVVESGATVEASILHGGGRVAEHSRCCGVWLGEASELSAGVQVESSYVAHDNHFGKGEVTSCFLGPFTGFHHQSLLISTLWPDGRGNVGYGANVGSNHTGRAPDQEFWVGEGCFLGLSSSVKFPCNLKDSPYTFVATGATLPSQVLACPFSLVLPSQAGDPPGSAGEIKPGWALRENLYALLRNAMKVARRGKAKGEVVDPHFLGDGVVAPLVEACIALEREDPKEHYRGLDMPILGGHHLREAWRLKAKEIYRETLEFIFLWKYHVQGQSPADMELPPWINLDGGLAVLGLHLELQLQRVQKSRAKDFTRGREVQEDYDGSQGSLEDDEVLICARERLESFQREGPKALIF